MKLYENALSSSTCSYVSSRCGSERRWMFDSIYSTRGQHFYQSISAVGGTCCRKRRMVVLDASCSHFELSSTTVGGTLGRTTDVWVFYRGYIRYAQTLKKILCATKHNRFRLMPLKSFSVIRT